MLGEDIPAKYAAGQSTVYDAKYTKDEEVSGKRCPQKRKVGVSVVSVIVVMRNYERWHTTGTKKCELVIYQCVEQRFTKILSTLQPCSTLQTDREVSTGFINFINNVAPGRRG